MPQLIGGVFEPEWALGSYPQQPPLSAFLGLRVM